MAVAARDGFNWGYDPLHYTTPEGCYATDPDGPARTLRVPRDGAGAQPARPARGDGRRLQPHHRRRARTRSRCSTASCPATTTGSTPTGAVETSTCCAEHRHRARDDGEADGRLGASPGRSDYKVDGFRFDLMGHHPKAQHAEAARARSTRSRREGRRGRQVDLPLRRGLELRRGGQQRAASSTPPSSNMAGTGIGTFNDRLRDAVRGGGPFEPTRGVQGFATGPVHRPQRRRRPTAPPAEQQARLLHYQDLIKLGLAGNLRDYAFVDSDGHDGHGRRDRLQRPARRLRRRPEDVDHLRRRARQRDAVRRPAAQAAAGDVDGRPGAHEHAGAGDRPRSGRAPSFWHAGIDLLRSKSLDRNSYDSGDWFNRIDWSGDESTLGLRPAAGARTTRPSGRSCGRCSPTRR